MAKNGLLLINLGSPDAPTAPAVKTYLTQFLTDKYVIDLPFLVRQALVRTVIAPSRSHKSAAAYAKIWRQEGSPLVHYTRQFAQKVEANLAGEYSVRWAMRYGSPAIAEAIEDWDVNKIYVVPLYPQFAESSTRTALEAAAEAVHAKDLQLQVLEDFYERPEFIRSMSLRLDRSRVDFQPDHILFSFHGLPEHHMTKLHPDHCLRTANCCDAIGPANRHCYRAQCYATARAIQRQLRLSGDASSVSFQSRLGRRPWVKPYTDFEIVELAKRGIKRLLVACPSFVADCLETLEEVEMRLREQFREVGGSELQLVPALNAEDFWVEEFCAMIRSTTLEWREYPKR